MLQRATLTNPGIALVFRAAGAGGRWPLCGPPSSGAHRPSDCCFPTAAVRLPIIYRAGLWITSDVRIDVRLGGRRPDTKATEITSPGSARTTAYISSGHVRASRYAFDSCPQPGHQCKCVGTEIFFKTKTPQITLIQCTQSGRPKNIPAQKQMIARPNPNPCDDSRFLSQCWHLHR